MPKKMDSIRRLFFFFKPYRGKLIIATIMMLISLTTITIAPSIEGLITSGLLADVQASVPIRYAYILRIILILLVLYLITNVCRVILQYHLTAAVQGSAFDMRTKIKEKLTRLPVRYFDGHSTGSVLSTVSTDVETIANALQQSLFQIVNTCLGFIFVIIMMFMIDVQLAIVGALILPVSLIIARVVVAKSQAIFNRQQNALADLNGEIQEMYSGFNEIKLFNQQAKTSAHFSQTNNNLRRNGFKALFASGLLSPIISLLTYLTIAVAIMMGIMKVIDGILLVGAIQAFVRYIWQENQYLSQITQLSSILQSSFAAMHRVFTFLDEPEEMKENPNPLVDTDFKGAVEFEHVYFSYDENPLIKNFNINVLPGQTVAIVGPTGAGKTTMINLLMRFYDVLQGAIKVDDIDIRDMRRNDLRALFAMVLQDTWLFTGTIHDNLIYGRPDATDEEVNAALKETKIDHFIRTLPGGLQMEINEEGSNISNGEKQLLTITRALIANPKILILDEATSSVDTRLEIMIQDAMTSLMQGRTSFVIAHRLSTIRNADVILVMNHGEIIEQGKHEELLAQNGFYANLYNAQFAEDD